MLNKNEIIKTYSQYGFELLEDDYRSFSLVFETTFGYHSAVDIISYDKKSDVSALLEKYKTQGFSTKLINYHEARSYESILFNGFFNVNKLKKDIEFNYSNFKETIMSLYDSNQEYKYLDAPYELSFYNEPDKGIIKEHSGLIGSLLEELNNHQPTLILIEAAAGFGKTCTAYELCHEIAKTKNIPLLTELSKNREARIFKHILLDEIDRTFPKLNSRLVESQIINGNIVTILDGFDELLREENNSINNLNEPMLETIGELLKCNAKIIITTRRTILFEGDAFHHWLEQNNDSFKVIKVKLSTPTIKNWLPEYRYHKLKESNFNLNNVANPVLLSYLRCISDENFNKICNTPDKIADSYFDFMLEREKVRQDITLNINEQHKILSTIAENMIEYSYTAEDRSYIVDYIKAFEESSLGNALSRYMPDKKPSFDELANKLASHALLDKSNRDPNKIGFINDFVLGNYCANVFLNHKKEFSHVDWRFIESSAIAYQTKDSETKMKLYTKLSPLLSKDDEANKIDLSIRLLGEIPYPLTNNIVDGIDFQEIKLGSYEINNFSFQDCIFNKCHFDFNKIRDVNFINCKFYKSNYENINNKDQKIFFLGCEGDYSEIEKNLERNAIESLIEDTNLIEEKIILSKFWPIGSESITHKHRHIRGICINSGESNLEKLLSAIKSLKRKEILLEPQDPSFVEINFKKIEDIKRILGK